MLSVSLHWAHLSSSSTESKSGPPSWGSSVRSMRLISGNTPFTGLFSEQNLSFSKKFCSLEWFFIWPIWQAFILPCEVETEVSVRLRPMLPSSDSAALKTDPGHLGSGVSPVQTEWQITSLSVNLLFFRCAESPSFKKVGKKTCLSVSLRPASVTSVGCALGSQTAPTWTSFKTEG